MKYSICRWTDKGGYERPHDGAIEIIEARTAKDAIIESIAWMNCDAQEDHIVDKGDHAHVETANGEVIEVISADAIEEDA
jgi:hypothetical protein